jgi:hypothetical protein
MHSVPSFFCIEVVAAHTHLECDFNLIKVFVFRLKQRSSLVNILDSFFVSPRAIPTQIVHNGWRQGFY